MSSKIRQDANIVLYKLIQSSFRDFRVTSEDVLSNGFSTKYFEELKEYITPKLEGIVGATGDTKNQHLYIHMGMKGKLDDFYNEGGFAKFDNYDDYLVHVEREKVKSDQRRDNQDDLIKYNIKEYKRKWVTNVMTITSVSVALATFLWNIYSRNVDERHTQKILNQTMTKEQILQIIELTNTKTLYRMDSLWKKDYDTISPKK